MSLNRVLIVPIFLSFRGLAELSLSQVGLFRQSSKRAPTATMENNGIMQLVSDSPYVDVLWRGVKEELAELFKWAMKAKQVSFNLRKFYFRFQRGSAPSL